MADEIPEHDGAEQKTPAAEDPQGRLDLLAVFSEPAWTLAQALSWVAYRDPARLNELGDRKLRRLALRPRTFTDIANPECVEVLHEALINSKLTAIRDREAIPPEHWIGMSLRMETITGFYVRRAEVLAMWPELTGADEKAAKLAEEAETDLPPQGPFDQSVDPKAVYKTGAPGRPSPISFVEAEAARRRETQEAHRTLAEEAKHLNKWCKQNHPNIVAPMKGTIENRIRDDHRAWKASRMEPNPHK